MANLGGQIMSKKLFNGILFCGLLFALSACGSPAQSNGPASSAAGDSSGEPATSEETSEDIDDGRELVEDELYTDSGLNIEFQARGAQIKKIEYYGDTIAKDGFIAGRCANRIAGASFELNGETYELSANENGNHLHGGVSGFGTRTWTKVDQTPSTITYSYHSEDGEMGYPGNLDVTVKYTLRQSGELTIEYSAICDADTIFNPTNHLWLSLNGDNRSTGHTFWLDADNYTETDAQLIPTGRILPVEGTKYDFREETEFDPANRYDDNFCLNGEGYRKVAKLTGTDLGIECEVYTDRPGFQVYNDTSYIVMETQLYPDAVHHDNFPSAVLRADTEFYSKTAYKFNLPE